MPAAKGQFIKKSRGRKKFLREEGTATLEDIVNAGKKKLNTKRRANPSDNEFLTVGQDTIGTRG